MKTDIEKIEAILKAVGAVTFTDGKRATANWTKSYNPLHIWKNVLRQMKS
jgi:hypothetical protein